MDHIRDEEWVDVVRGVLPAARAGAIAAHLERCERCARVRKLWRAVAHVAGHEQLYSPPGDSVRVARAALAASGGPPQRAPFWATLVFDSLREAGAGIRGAAVRPRQLLYQAGALSIDLRLVPSRGSARHVLLGQVADASRPDAPCGGCRVDMLAGDRALETASANDLGEFELQFVPEPNLALLVSVTDRPPVNVPLWGVMPER
jgi:hypothetical protein